MNVRALMLALLLSGCAVVKQPEKSDVLLTGEVRSAQAARDALALGKSTKADVRAALGKATEVGFDTGYEVWVYREKTKPLEDGKPPPPRPELVLLFAPTGVLSKARLGST